MSKHRHGVCQIYQFFKRSWKFGFLCDSPQFLNVGLAFSTNTSKAKQNTSVGQQFAISAIFFSYELLLNSPLFCFFKGFFEIKCWTLCVSLLVSSCQFCLIVPAFWDLLESWWPSHLSWADLPDGPSMSSFKLHMKRLTRMSSESRGMLLETSHFSLLILILVKVPGPGDKGLFFRSSVSVQGCVS